MHACVLSANPGAPGHHAGVPASAMLQQAMERFARADKGAVLLLQGSLRAQVSDFQARTLAV